MRNPKQNAKSETKCEIRNTKPAGLLMRMSGFEFVSDFAIRISDLLRHRTAG